jgi:hypothetical protein
MKTKSQVHKLSLIGEPRIRSIMWLLVWAGLMVAAFLYVVSAGGTPALAQHDHGNHAPAAGTIPPPLPAMSLFQANLAAANETHAPDSIAAGRVVMAIISDTLYMRILVADIDNIIAAHIHQGGPGVNGPIVATLYTAADGPFDPAHPITASAPLASVVMTDLVTGQYYVNIHTMDFPAGEIRGQLIPYAPPQKFSSLLIGENEAPTPVTNTQASGVGYFTLISSDTLTYVVHVSNIVSITAAHIHYGPNGVSGPVVSAIYTGTGSFGPGNPVAGSLQINGIALVNLLTNYLYVNVHTVTHPAGEIRGQIGGANTFAACLIGAEEVPPVTTLAGGTGILALDADGKTLDYRVMVQNIDKITMAHIHKGDVGANGPALFTLYNGTGAFGAGQPISGTVQLNAEQVMEMIAGRYYINVHTSDYPAGEIRGQIDAYDPPAHLNAPLLGANEVPAVATSAVGLARHTFSAALDQIVTSVIVTDITDITAAHIHFGPVGVNGGVVKLLYSTASPESFTSSNPIAHGGALSGSDWVNALTGYWYVNIHTVAHPSGEIRGQVGAERAYMSALSGANEVPPVATNATGRSVLALNDEATALSYRLAVKDIEHITAAHIHRGAVGVNGPVIATLYNGVGDFDPSHPIAGSAALGTTDILRLLKQGLYLNVHTMHAPGGEIRGQITPQLTPSDYAAVMSGANEVPPVTSLGFGLTHLSYSEATGMIQYSVAVSNVVGATAAHIHVAPTGQNGPVVYGLFNAATDGTLDASHPLGGCINPTSMDLVNLLSGYWYVNVHTTANPGGEIRGQVYPVSRQFLPLISTVATD